MTNIPSDEEFEIASRLMRKKSANLDQVRESVRKRFLNLYSIHDFYILPQRDVNFRAYIFFEKKEDIATCESQGVAREIEEFVYGELERVGRGRRDEISVAFEWDSHERVMSQFEGDYFLRLR